MIIPVVDQWHEAVCLFLSIDDNPFDRRSAAAFADCDVIKSFPVAIVDLK